MGFLKKAAGMAAGAAIDAAAHPGKTSSFMAVAARAVADNGLSGTAAVIATAGAAAVAAHDAMAGNVGGENVQYAGFTEEPKRKGWRR